MEERIETMPFDSLKGAKVRVHASGSSFTYEAVITDVTPGCMPWRSAKVEPITHNPNARAKWVQVKNLEILEYGH